MDPTRRRLAARMLGGATLAAFVAAPALAASRRALVSMTDGPFYPSRAWRETGPWAGDWDADLTRVVRAGRTGVARGEHLGLEASVVDTDGRPIDDAEVEVWQCDVMRTYRHPHGAAAGERIDEGFQGFGATRSDRDGALRLRTIRPVPYPGRTPHIHVKLRHASFGEWTSQLFVADDPGNARDFLWRQVPAEARAAVEMRLERASGPAAAGGLAWLARHALVVPA